MQESKLGIHPGWQERNPAHLLKFTIAARFIELQWSAGKNKEIDMAGKVDLSDCIEAMKEMGPKSVDTDGHRFTRDSILDVVRAKILWSNHCRVEEAAKNPKGAISSIRMRFTKRRSKCGGC